MEHISVLLDESIDMLQVKPDGIYVDCTLGRGGHSSKILEKLTTGRLIAFDLDQNAIDESRKRLEAISDRFTLVHAPFEQLDEKLDELGIGQVDGILMDLGVSSPQFDDPDRGFSYRFDAPLDMRMDQTQSLDAKTIVNTYSKEELYRILKEYGEEPNASRIVSGILKARENGPIETTFQLVDIIKDSLPAAVLKKKGHPAKQTFQALRIEVNQELPQLRRTLEEGLDRLACGGRMAVITFHSLEDRIVKQAFSARAKPPKTNRRIPEAGTPKLEYRLINRKPILASAAELEDNNRAHSAKLRGVERIEDCSS